MSHPLDYLHLNPKVGLSPMVSDSPAEPRVGSLSRLRERDLHYFDGFLPFEESCLAAFCFLLLSLSFLPPLSPIVKSPYSSRSSFKRVHSQTLSPLESGMSNPTPRNLIAPDQNASVDK